MFGKDWGHNVTEDIPIGAGSTYKKRDMNLLLPRYLWGRYELYSFEPSASVDPVVLRNQWRQIVYQWPDGYEPSWIDVLIVVNQLGLK